VGDLSTAPVSPDIDYVEGSILSLRKIEDHRTKVTNVTPVTKKKFLKRTLVHVQAGVLRLFPPLKSLV